MLSFVEARRRAPTRNTGKPRPSAFGATPLPTGGREPLDTPNLSGGPQTTTHTRAQMSRRPSSPTIASRRKARLMAAGVACVVRVRNSSVSVGAAIMAHSASETARRAVRNHHRSRRSVAGRRTPAITALRESNRTSRRAPLPVSGCVSLRTKGDHHPRAAFSAVLRTWRVLAADLAFTATEASPGCCRCAKARPPRRSPAFAALVPCAADTSLNRRNKASSKSARASILPRGATPMLGAKPKRMH